ncbi:hypothetical protein [Paraglaciecola sp.]|uniref:hypothetical protein n=1 Tax=Paraglaciecola sp. TaxID=1920173 RepID=UPI0030F3711C
MTSTTKAVLLSALVFPGCGHLWLKSKLIGGLLIAVTVVCMYFLLSNAMEIANQISAKILSGEIPLDVARISEAVSAGLAGSNSLQITIATWALVITWLIGILDTYRVAKQSA